MAATQQRKTVVKIGRPDNTPDPDSRVTRICLLSNGECESISARIPFKKALPDEVLETKKRLGNTLRAATRRAADRSGNKYDTETGDFRAENGDLLVTAVVTRVG